MLLCFAVKEEARHLRRETSEQNHVLLTGMGKRNADRAIREFLKHNKPKMVLSCGFAGGLNPKLNLGTVVFDEDAGLGLSETLTKQGAVPASFHCAEKVAVTVAQKTALRNQTGADAVEMESSVIRAACKEFGIPSATIRVISDTASEDLPLDFNALMTSNDAISYPKLVRTILFSPNKIPRLIQFQKQTSEAARRLAFVLENLLRSLGS